MKPISLAQWEIKALLDNRKTHIQKVLNLPRWATNWSDFEINSEGLPEVICENTGCLADIPCLYSIGELVWVQETWYVSPSWGRNAIRRGYALSRNDVTYRASEKYPDSGCYLWNPSIQMPEWASRFLLEIEDIQVDRLQSITPEEILAEGVRKVRDNSWLGPLEGAEYPFGHAWEAYSHYWDEQHTKLAQRWDWNPWVWKIQFKKVKYYG